MSTRLDDELARWTAASLITAEQAEAIRRLEAGGTRASPPAGRIPLIAEALGFLGGALAVIAGVVATSRFWDEFSTATRLAVVGGVTGLLVGAGRVVRREGEPALDHLGSFLWLLAAGGAAFWAGILGGDALDWEEADLVVLVGGVAAAVAAALWAWRPAPLQHAATALALAVTVSGLAGQVEHVGGRFIGIALWALGVGWVLLAWIGALRPAALAYALGGGLAIVAGRILGDEGLWADGLSITTALALLAASVPTRSMVLLWVGVVGVFFSVPVAITRQFGDSLGAPVVLFLAGMALIGLAIVASRLVDKVRAAPPKPSRFSSATRAGALAGVVVAVVGLTVGLTDIEGVPAFPSLRAAPDTAIGGTVAFVRRDREAGCVYVTAAGGQGEERRLFCGENVDFLSWDATGALVATQFTGGGLQRVVIDAATGAVVRREPAPEPAKGAFDGGWATSDGAVLEVHEKRLVVRSASGATRTVFAAGGPVDYRLNSAIWSPDGRYAAVVDSEQRLLIVDVEGGTPAARVLAEEATSPAWSTR